MTTWALGPGDETGAVTTLTASGVTIFGSGISLTTEDKVTISRIRGFMNFALSSATAAGDGFLIGAGIALVSADAFGVGATAVPHPIDDANWPGWMWHQLLDLDVVAAGVDGANILGNARVPIDSKAQRIMGTNEVMCTILQVIERTTATVAITGLTRVLLKLA